MPLDQEREVKKCVLSKGGGYINAYCQGVAVVQKQISWGRDCVCENMELDRNNLNTNSNTIKAYQMYPMKSNNVDLIRRSIQKKGWCYTGMGMRSLLLFQQEIHKWQLAAEYCCLLMHSYVICNYNRSKCRANSSQTTECIALIIRFWGMSSITKSHGI